MLRPYLPGGSTVKCDHILLSIQQPCEDIVLCTASSWCYLLCDVFLLSLSLALDFFSHCLSFCHCCIRMFVGITVKVK